MANLQTNQRQAAPPQNRKVEKPEPSAPEVNRHEDTGMEFTDLGGGSDNIKHQWSVDELAALGIKISPRVKANVNGTLYLLASMNGKIETVYFSDKLKKEIAEGDKLQKSQVAFYTIDNGTDVFTVCGKVGAGLEDWD